MRAGGSKKIKIEKILVFAGLLALLLPAGLLFMHKKTSSAKEETLVKSAEVEKGDVNTSISATGSLTADDGTVISLPVGIRINKVLVSAGDPVEKGTKIASLDKVSVANVLLDVNECIDQVEDAFDDLDDTDDTDSDDYLKRLVYDQELEELNKMQTKLKKWLSSGYITASAEGTIAGIKLEDGKEITASSDQDTDSSGSSNTGNSQSSSANTTVASNSVYMSTSIATASRTSTISGANVKASYMGQVTAGEAAAETTTEETTEAETEIEAETSEDSGADSGQDTGQSDADTSNNRSSNASSNAGGSTNTLPSGSKPSVSSGKGAAQSAVSGSSETTSASSDISMIETAEAYSLCADDTMLVTVYVDEADINSVSQGQTAQITIEALNEESIEGEIISVTNTASSSSNGSAKYQVDVRISKEEGMKEGMTASVLIITEEASDALLIPSAAIQEEKGSLYVYTEQEKDGTLSGKTEVTSGISDGSKIQITEGLSEGDTVYYEVKGSSDQNEDDKHMPGMNGGDMPAGGPGGNGGMPSGGPDH